MATKNLNLGIVPVSRGEFNSTTMYYKDNIVQYKRGSYQVVSESPIIGVSPTNDKNIVNPGWKLFAGTLDAQDVVNQIKEQEAKSIQAVAAREAEILAKSDAAEVSFNNTDTSLSGTNVQDALKETGGKLSKLESEVIYDVTANNNGATFTSLSALLSDENLSTFIPESIRCGGMSIRFVQSSDNKYVQYRYKSSSIAAADFTNVANWEKQGAEVGVSQDTEIGTYQLNTGDKTLLEGTNLESYLLGLNRMVHYKGNLANTKIESYDSAKYVVFPISGGDFITLSATGRCRVMVLSEFQFNADLPYNVTYATGESIRGVDSGSYYVSFSAPDNAKFLLCSYMRATGELTNWNGIEINGNNVKRSIADIITDDFKMKRNISNNADLNTLPASSIYAIPWGYNVSHQPSELISGQFSGIILKFRHARSGDTGGQILITAYGMFYRYYTGSYLDWNKIPDSVQFDRLKDILGYVEPQFTYTDNSHVGINGDIIYMSNDTGWKITNAIYLKRGQKIYIKAVGYKTAVGILTQFNGDTPQNVIIRSIDSTYRWYNTEIIADGYYRISGSSSASYPFVVYIADKVNAQSRHPFQAFLNVGVIGDSLANGATITNGTWYSNVKMSWPQVMKRMTGNNIINFTRGGLTAYEWMLDSVNGYAKAILPDNICETYIIGLGVNDGSRITKYEAGTPSTDHLFPMGTMSDINDSDYTQNGDSFYGHYAKIIQAMKASYPKDKFFCIKLPTKLPDDSSTSAEMSQRLNYAIQEICDHFSNCVTIQLANYAVFSERHSEIYDNERGGHYNAITYQYVAELIYQALNDKMMSEEWKYRYIELINTEYEDLIPSSTE